MTETVIVRNTTFRRILWHGPFIAFYAVALTLGALYIADVHTARALASAADGATAVSWQWCLTLGGVIGLVGAVVSTFTPDHWWWSLVVDAIGAAMIAVSLTIYVGVIWLGATTPTPPWATIGWCGGVAVALLLRVLSCFVARGDRLDLETALTRVIEGQ